VKTTARITVPIVIVVAIVAVCIGAVYAGVTEPAHRILGLSARHADITACWTLFLLLPAACALDAMTLSTARWAAAQRSKPAWIGLLVYLPIAGPLLYVTLARPRVSGARPDRPPRIEVMEQRFRERTCG